VSFGPVNPTVRLVWQFSLKSRPSFTSIGKADWHVLYMAGLCQTVPAEISVPISGV